MLNFLSSYSLYLYIILIIITVTSTQTRSSLLSLSNAQTRERSLHAGNGFIEGTELDGFLREFVSSANPTEVNSEVSQSFSSSFISFSVTLKIEFAAIKKKLF